MKKTEKKSRHIIHVEDSLWAKALATGNASHLVSTLLKKYFKRKDKD